VPSPIDWPAKSWNIGLSILVAIGAIFVAIAPALMYVIYMVFTGAYDPRHPMANLNVTLTAQVVSYLPTAIYFVAVLPLLAHVSLPSLGFRAPTPRIVGIALLGMIVMTLAVGSVSAIVTGITHHQDTEVAIELLKSLKTVGEKINFVLVAIVLAPMVEELVFRVFLYNALSRYMPVALAIVVSGLAFGAVHVIGTPASQLVTVALPLAFGGMTLAFVYATTRNYWGNVIMHGTFNLVGVVQVLYFHGS
jgi:membrane protease YdiL (CAAX protease family)